MAAAVPIIVAATAVIGTGLSVYSGVKSSQAAQKEAKARKRQADLAAIRERRQAIAAAQKARASQLATVTAQGAQGSSSAAGAMAGTTGQLNNFLTASSQNQGIGSQIFSAQRQQFAMNNLATIGQGIQTLGSAFGQAYKQSQEV